MFTYCKGNIIILIWFFLITIIFMISQNLFKSESISLIRVIQNLFARINRDRMM